MLKFEQLEFVKPHQDFKDMIRINSLPPGFYGFVVRYDNTRQASPRLPHLVFPKELNGYKKWIGIAKADTLYLNIK